MHAKMQYLEDRRSERDRLRELWSRDMTPRGKETSLKVWARQGNRRMRREERQDVLDRLEDMDPRWDAEEALSRGERPREYRWEAGYRGNDENVFEVWQDACSCEECGRYVPSTKSWGVYGWDSHGYYARERYDAVAHVDHEGRPCPGGQTIAERGYICLSIRDVEGVDHSWLDRMGIDSEGRDEHGQTV